MSRMMTFQAFFAKSSAITFPKPTASVGDYTSAPFQQQGRNQTLTASGHDYDLLLRDHVDSLACCSANDRVLI